jgi:RNA-directed DNA polymerase
MDTKPEEQPPPVPATATQGGKTTARVAGVEPTVWTERMLAALATGPKGNKWFSLIDKVYREETLRLAWAKVASNDGSCGVDGITVERFEQNCTAGLLVLKEQLQEASYQPSAVKRVWIPKLGSTEKRPLGIPTVRDRIVQTALRMVIEPIFEVKFAEHSMGFRPGRGCRDALRRVQHLLDEGCTWIVDADLKSYFDTIPHERLMERVAERIADGRILALIESYLKQGVMDTLRYCEAAEEGTPQGAVISPLLANIYLDPLDHLIAAHGFEMVRYADDFIILCRTKEAAEAALTHVQTWVRDNGLTLHPTKTRIVDATQKGGFDFLGYHFERDYRWPRKKSMDKLRASIRELTPRRTCGWSLEVCIAELNTRLRGWYGYFKHSHHTSFGYVDSYVRGRLRAILRNRLGRRGRSRGRDHQLWPNHYFVKLGLFSLRQAHVETLASLRHGATH